MLCLEKNRIDGKNQSKIHGNVNSRITDEKKVETK